MSIDLTTPKQLLSDATKLVPERVQVDRYSMRIWYSWRDDANVSLKNDVITITGTDYTDIMSALVPSNAVGVPLGTVLLVAIKRKIQSMLALAGTVENTGF